MQYMEKTLGILFISKKHKKSSLDMYLKIAQTRLQIASSTTVYKNKQKWKLLKYKIVEKTEFSLLYMYDIYVKMWKWSENWIKGVGMNVGLII